MIIWWTVFRRSTWGLLNVDPFIYRTYICILLFYTDQLTGNYTTCLPLLVNFVLSKHTQIGFLNFTLKAFNILDLNWGFYHYCESKLTAFPLMNQFVILKTGVILMEENVNEITGISEEFVYNSSDTIYQISSIICWFFSYSENKIQKLKHYEKHHTKHI